MTLQELEEGLIHPPGKGRVVSREEFEKIVEEKMEELMRVRGPRKIGSPFEAQIPHALPPGSAGANGSCNWGV